MINNISVTDLKKVYDRVNIIDLRGIESYNNNHIPTAINIPFEQLIIYPDKFLNKNTIYYIYCTRGMKSLKAIQILMKQGYQFVHVNGGYEEWVLEN